MMKKIKNAKLLVAAVILSVSASSATCASSQSEQAQAAYVADQELQSAQPGQTQEQFEKLAQGFLAAKAPSLAKRAGLAAGKNAFNIAMPIVVTAMVGCVVANGSKVDKNGPIADAIMSIAGILTNLSQFGVDKFANLPDGSLKALKQINEFVVKLTPEERANLVQKSDELMEQIASKVLSELDSKNIQVASVISDLGGLGATGLMGALGLWVAYKSINDGRKECARINIAYVVASAAIIAAKIVQTIYNHKHSPSNQKQELLKKIKENLSCQEASTYR